MKALNHPRAVILTADHRAYENLREALRTVGIDGYQAASLESAVQRAMRQDTLLVVIDARDLPPAEAATGISAIRKEPKARDVLIAVVAAENGDEPYYEAGANVVQRPPVTPAAAYATLAALARRPRLASMTAAPTAEAHDDPHEVFKVLVARRMARLKIYLGAAPGVGKTYAMLREAHEARLRGEDVAVGIVETHGRAETLQQTAEHEIIARKQVAYRGAALEEMDVDAIIARRPALVLVDELAHTNVPGSINKKRYEDVQTIRLAGVPVISTVNIQHLESLNNIVERITGVKVRETIPDAMLEEAEEVVLVDISPEALQKRLQAGKIYAPEKITQSLTNFFTVHNLTALRELVLRELADTVDERLEEVRATIGKAAEPTGIQDRLLVCITPTRSAQRIIRRGARLAGRLNGRMIVLFVESQPLSEDERRAIAQCTELAESFEAEVVKLRHPEPGEAIARYATQHNISMVLLGETRKTRLSLLFRKSIFEEILERTTNIDIVTVATHVEAP